MNKLSVRIIDFASHKAAKGASAPRFARPMPASILTCRWRHDPVTGRLVCVWGKESESKDADLVGLRRHRANLRTAA